MTKAINAEKDAQVAHWQTEIERAKKRFRVFWDDGDQVVDAYRIQKANGENGAFKDKYNILFSSTETIRPNLYAQSPMARVVLNNKDTASSVARTAAKLLEGDVKYLQRESDFDELMNNVVEDLLLPGLGIGFVRYEANIEGEGDEAKLLDEMVYMEYTYWQDFLMGIARTWKEVPWVAKRVWMNKKDAGERFGEAKAALLQYDTRDNKTRDADNPSDTAEVWEIWDKRSRTVYWYAENCPHLLDSKPDPLKLKGFFPCPKPLRAISNTRTLVPRALYSQYKSQAETLNTMTRRIRLLSEALKVVGVYNGAEIKLKDILAPESGNKMIGVENWALFAQSGGIKNNVEWVPIDTVVKVLNELLTAREVCKQEIYEITGFSDIVRGVSKASETLGAQNLKANWAGARVKKQQAEVQRFARDMLAMAGELVAEHCSPETIIMFSGAEIPTAQAVERDPGLQAMISEAMEACALIKSEMRRVSVIDIETDSTLLADESTEREDRMKFLSSIGAFLQQAIPAAEASPEMAPLLAEIMMFTVRTFPSSRGIEDTFEQVQKAMAAKAANPDQDPGGAKAKAQADAQKAQADAATAQAEIQAKQQADAAKLQLDGLSEQNRHAEQMLDKQIRQQELGLKDRELAIKEREIERELALEAEKVRIAQEEADTRAATAASASAVSEATLAHTVEHDTAQLELAYDELAASQEAQDADREAAAKAAAAKPAKPAGDA